MVFGWLSNLASGFLGGGGIGGLISKGLGWLGRVFRPQVNIYNRKASNPPSQQAPAALPAPNQMQSTSVGGGATRGGGGQTEAPGQASQQGRLVLNDTGQMIAPWLASGLRWGAGKLFNAALSPFGTYVQDVQQNQIMPYVAPGQSAALTYSEGLRRINQFNRGAPPPGDPMQASNVQRPEDQLD